MRTSCDAIPNNVTGIYLIRNNINNKIYIGQSTDIHRRWLEHLRSGQPEKYCKKSERDSNTPIHKAMQKYGVENFSISILEQCDKNLLNEKEKYWIKTLRSQDKDIGYNLGEGGQESFALKGENHSQAKLTQKDVDEIINLLTICLINTGKTWFNKDLKYPIRITNTGMKGEKNPKAKFTEEQVMEMRKLYSQGECPKDIKIKYHHIASDNAIDAILYGKTYTHLPIWKNKTHEWIEPCIDYSQS